MRAFFEQIFGGAVGLALLFAFGVGGIYWLWMAIMMKSFFMFLLGVFPLTAMLTAPIGAWSLLFGVPNWVFGFFG